MDEGRLGAVRRQQDHHRKGTIVMNDIINFQQNVYTCYLKRERQSTEAKMKAQEVFLKRSLVRNSYLLQCLEDRKEKIAERAPEKLIYGRYGGRPIHSFSRDVDACISWMHPRLRRLRRVERAKEKGLKKIRQKEGKPAYNKGLSSGIIVNKQVLEWPLTGGTRNMSKFILIIDICLFLYLSIVLGAIMDFSTIPDKMEAIFRKTTPEKHEKDNSGALPVPSTSKLGNTTIRNQSLGLPNSLKIQHGFYNGSLVSRDGDDNPRDLDQSVHSNSTFTKERQNQIRYKPDIKNQKSETTQEIDSNDQNNLSSSSSHGDSSIQKKEATQLSRELTTQDNTETDDVDRRGEMSKVTAVSSPPPLSRRPTLILPPIKTTKDMKLRGFEGL